MHPLDELLEQYTSPPVEMSENASLWHEVEECLSMLSYSEENWAILQHNSADLPVKFSENKVKAVTEWHQYFTDLFGQLKRAGGVRSTGEVLSGWLEQHYPVVRSAWLKNEIQFTHPSQY